MATHNSKSIPQNIDLYRTRAASIDLIWCDQIVRLISNLFIEEDFFSINDIGCNYFQLWKEIKRQGLNFKCDYKGYDIDQNFINLGLEFFPELKNSYQIHDIEKNSVPVSDIVVCSACYEHVDEHNLALKNIINSTKKYIILRTFLGDKDLFEVQDDPQIVASSYNINQFSMFKIIDLFIRGGMSVKIFPDIATKNSEVYSIGKIKRQMFILLCEKIIKN